MRRRALLATIAALSGCNAAPPTSNQTSKPDTTPTNTSHGRCPPAPDSEATVQCSDSDTQSAVRMTVSPSSLNLPRDSTQFTLHNESEERLSSGFGTDPAQLFVYTGDHWEFIEPKVRLLAGNGVELQPGETHEWDFNVNTANLGSLTPDRGNNRSSTFRFPPGTYAFGARVTPNQSESPTLYTTTFTVSGETPQLIPSDIVDTHSRQGNTLTVKTQTTKEDDNSRRVSLLIERDSTTQQAATLSLFELYNPRYQQVPNYDRTFVSTQIAELLRDALAFVNSLDDQVKIHTVDTAHPPLGMNGNESLLVRYSGSTWKLTAQNGWA